MPETTAAAKTTTPRRQPARKPAATKPAAAKAAPKAATKAATKPVEPSAPTTDALTVEMEYVGDTARYAKFAFSADLQGTMVGNVYAPLGTDRVRVRITGVDSTATDDE